jgi:hypothetical protein
VLASIEMTIKILEGKNVMGIALKRAEEVWMENV